MIGHVDTAASSQKCVLHTVFVFYELRFKVNSIFDISINNFSDDFNFLYSNS